MISFLGRFLRSEHLWHRVNDLSVLFIIAKVCGWPTIGDWAWWLVLTPMWGTFVIQMAILAADTLRDLEGE